MLVDYKTPADLPSALPVFPLSGALLLPRVLLPLNIFEPRYLDMISDAMSSHRLIGMIQPDAQPDYGKAGLQTVGCAGRITAYSETEDGRLLITLSGVSRFLITEELDVTTPYRQVRASFDAYANDLVEGYGDTDVNRDRLVSLLRQYLDANDMQGDWEAIQQSSTEELVNSLSVVSPYGPQEKQALLEAETLANRADILIAMTEMVLAQSGQENTRLQ